MYSVHPRAGPEIGLPVMARASTDGPFYPSEIGTMSEEQVIRALCARLIDYPAGAFGRDRIVGRNRGRRAQGVTAVGKANIATNRRSSRTPVNSESRRSSNSNISRTPESIPST